MSHVAIGDIVLRILAAFGAGFAIGWERESRGRPAGLRTNILACVAAAVAMVTSVLLTRQMEGVPSSGAHADVTRFGSGMLAGIGFLGAGTIMRHGEFVRGVTTAATLWFATILGLAFGCGFFALGGIGLGFALITLRLLPHLENLFASDWYAAVSLTTRLDGLSGPELRQRIEAQGPRVLKTKMEQDLETRQKTFHFELKGKSPQELELAERIFHELEQTPGVVKVEWK